MRSTITFLLFLFTYTSIGQNIKWIKKPKYTGGIFLTNGTILYNDKECIILNKDGIKPYHPISNHSSTAYGKTLVTIGKKTYLLDDDLNIDFDKSIDLDVGKLSHPYPDFEVLGNTITYIINDSIFVDNFKKNNKQYLVTGMKPRLENEKYLLLDRGDSSDQACKIYIFETGELKQLSEKYWSLIPDNENYLVAQMDHEEVFTSYEVIDLDLNIIIDGKEGYEDASVLNNFFSLNHRSKGPRLWHNTTEIKDLPIDIDFIEVGTNTGFSIVKSKGKYGLIDKKGKIFLPIQYRYISALGRITAFSQDHNCILDENGKILFEDTSPVDHFYQDLYYVSQKSQKTKHNLGFIKNKENEIILSRYKKGALFSGFNVIRAYGKTFILKRLSNHPDSLFTLDGKFIADLEVRNNVPRYFHTADHYGYNIETVRNWNQEQISKINPNDIWMKMDVEGITRRFKLENHKGKPLSAWYARLKNYNGSNVFAAQCLNGLFGIFEVPVN